MTVVVVSLDTLTEVKRFETGPGAIIHFGNAFEEGDEIVVDGMFTDNFEANQTLGRPSSIRTADSAAAPTTVID